MKIKTNVKLLGLRPEILLALFIADKIYSNHNQELVLTEATGGKHGRASLHYVGLAVDVRTHYFTDGEVKLVAKDLKEALGENYDVVVEKTHIHIEFQPK